MPRLDSTNVFAYFSLALGIASIVTLVLAAGSGPLGGLIIVLGMIAAVAAILFGIVGLAVVRYAGSRGIPEALAGALLGVLCLAAIFLGTSDVRPVDERMQSANNLKQIGLAIHNYHDFFQVLPSTVRDRDGKPLLSARVLLLPFLEADAQYRQFHFDEPWNSPHNLALLNHMPAVFRSPRDESKQSNLTFYRFVTGPGTAFERDGLKFFEIQDGLHETMFALEAGEAVPWTKPEEWEYQPGQPLPAVGGIFIPKKWYQVRRGYRDGTNVLFGDAGVHFLPRDTPESSWRAIATRSGHEPVKLP